MSRRRYVHPSKARLRTWLAGGDPELDEHVHACNRCAERVEELESEQSSNLAQALSILLTPPEDLRPRLAEGIGRKVQAREDLTLLGDLMGVSWRTLKVLSQGSTPEGAGANE